MAKLSTTTLKGASGETYKFDVYSWETIFRHGLAGVYFIAKRYKLGDGQFTLDPIYIGELADLSVLFGFHKKQSCFQKHGANCRCIYVCSDSEQRKEIVEDLIEENEPYCND